MIFQLISLFIIGSYSYNIIYLNYFLLIIDNLNLFLIASIWFLIKIFSILDFYC